MSDRFDAIVIGAGHNGLACAAYLGRAGRRVLVLEAGAHVGGAACTREFHEGYSVSAGAHLLFMLHPEIIADLDLTRHGLQAAPENLDTLALVPGGEPLRLNGRVADGASLSQRDRSAYAAFMDRMRRFAGVLAASYLDRPPRLVHSGIRDSLNLGRLALSVRRLGRDDMRELLRIGGMNINDLLNEEFEDRALKGAIALDAVLGSFMGPRSPNTVLTLLHRLTGQCSGSAMSLPDGGMGAVSNALARSAEAAGVTLRTGSPVTRIVVEKGRVAGVVTAAGESVQAGLVVSGADPRTTMLSLLGARHLDTDVARRFGRIRMNGVSAKLHLALRDLPEVPGMDAAVLSQRVVLAPDPDYVENAFNYCKYGEFSPEPAMEIVIPSMRDPSLVPGGGHVLSAVVQFAPYLLRSGWETGRAACLDAALGRLESVMPGIRELIVASELLSPADMEREFRMAGGHWHHGELALDQFLMLRPVPGAAQYATPVPGLYLCSAGVHPGGGVSGLPGRNAAREVLRGGKA